MASNFLIGLMVILMLVVIFSALFWPNEPLSDRIDLDEDCNYYFKVLATKGKLTSQQRSVLQSNLQAKGFENISITITEGKGHGSEVKMIVDVDKRYRVQNGFSQEEKIMGLHYEQTTLCTMLEVGP